MSACDSSAGSRPSRFGGTLSLSRPPPPKVAAMVAAIKSPQAPKPPPAEPQCASNPCALPPAKPPTKRDRGPVVLLPPGSPTPGAVEAAAERQRIAWRVADLALCRERYPALFDPDHPVPLAIHIHKSGRLGQLLGIKRAKRLLDWWTSQPAYVAAVAAGGQRLNLDGSSAGEVSPQHCAVAQAALLSRAQPIDLPPSVGVRQMEDAA